MGSRTKSHRPVCCSRVERLNRTQNRKAGNGVNDNTYFSRARASWRQHNASTLQLCVESVSRPEAKFAANRTGKNDLTLR
jgi:hypothetical protein